MDSFLVILFLSALRLSIPLIFAAYGAYFSEKSGVAQISVEAFLLVGAFSAATTAYFTNSLALSFFIAALSAVLLAQIFCLLVLKLKTHSIIAGTGLNLLALGLIPIISKSIFNSTGSTPAHTMNEYSGFWPMGLLVVTAALCYSISEKSIWGLQMKFAGEKSAALASIGVSTVQRQWQSVTLGASIAGLGGAVLSLFMSSSYSPMMSAGRGFIALAAVIFAGWKINKAIIICFFFGLTEALQIQLQSNQQISNYVPAIILQILPYLLTLIVLLTYKEKNQAPAELR